MKRPYHVVAFNTIVHAPFGRGVGKGKVVNVRDDIKLKTAFSAGFLNQKIWVRIIRSFLVVF